MATHRASSALSTTARDADATSVIELGRSDPNREDTMVTENLIRVASVRLGQAQIQQKLAAAFRPRDEEE